MNGTSHFHGSQTQPEPQPISVAASASCGMRRALTAAREKKESRRAREGEPDPHDPMDLLLAHGLRALLNKVVVLHGAHKFLGLGSPLVGRRVALGKHSIRTKPDSSNQPNELYTL